MTELAAAKTMMALVPVPPLAFAVVETSTQMAIINLVTLVVVTVGGAFSIWIALRQAQLKAKVDDIEHNTNSMREALVNKTAEASENAGILKGVAQAEYKSGIIAVAKAEGAAVEAAKKLP